MEGMLAQARDTGTWFEDWGLAILITFSVAIVLTIVLEILVRRFRKKLEGTPSVTQELNLQRIGTLTTALSTTGIVVVWSVAILIALEKLGVPLGPLFASAGIAGIALGFGAQSIVRDTLSGFFILLENQFGVGDTLELHTTAGPVSGRVEVLTLRVATLRAFDGTLHIVPNGNIQIVSNRSRGWARAIVDVRFGYSEDIERVRAVLDDLFEDVRADATLADWIREGPSVLGVERMGDHGLVVRVVADTRPSKRWDTERALRERIARRLDAEGIVVPVPPTIVPGGSAAG